MLAALPVAAVVARGFAPAPAHTWAHLGGTVLPATSPTRSRWLLGVGAGVAFGRRRDRLAGRACRFPGSAFLRVGAAAAAGDARRT